MARGEIRYGDNGTKHLITVKDQDKAVVDMSEATEITITYRKPDGTTFDKTAVLVTDGTDGLIQTFLLSTDLDTVGHYKWQGYYVFPLGSWRSDIHDIEVRANLA